LPVSGLFLAEVAGIVNDMKKLLLASLGSVAAFSVQAREFPDLFATPRMLSMGRATTAIVDDWNALYSNPAGLAQIETWELRAPDLVMVQGSPSIMDIVKTIGDLDSSQSVTQQLRQFDGKAASFGVDAPAFVWSRRGMAVGLNTASINGSLRVRVPSVLFASVNARTTLDSGLSLAYAHRFYDNKLRVGLTVRPFLVRAGFDKQLDTGDISELQEADFFQKQGGMGWGFDADLGAQGNLDPINIVGLQVKPMAGIVFNNMLATKYSNKILADKFLGSAPQLERKANIGVGASIENLGIFRPLLSLEYRNIFIPTGSMLENIALGTELGFKLRSWFKTAFRGHFASGNLGGGVGLVVGPADIELGTYAVNLGNGVGVGVSRRLYTKLGMAW